MALEHVRDSIREALDAVESAIRERDASGASDPGEAYVAPVTTGGPNDPYTPPPAAEPGDDTPTETGDGSSGGPSTELEPDADVTPVAPSTDAPSTEGL